MTIDSPETYFRVLSISAQAESSATSHNKASQDGVTARSRRASDIVLRGYCHLTDSLALLMHIQDIDDCLYSRDKGVDKMMYNKTEQVRCVPFNHAKLGTTN